MNKLSFRASEWMKTTWGWAAVIEPYTELTKEEANTITSGVRIDMVDYEVLAIESYCVSNWYRHRFAIVIKGDPVTLISARQALSLLS